MLTGQVLPVPLLFVYTTGQMLCFFLRLNPYLTSYVTRLLCNNAGKLHFWISLGSECMIDLGMIWFTHITHKTNLPFSSKVHSIKFSAQTNVFPCRVCNNTQKYVKNGHRTILEKLLDNMYKASIICCQKETLIFHRSI